MPQTLLNRIAYVAILSVFLVLGTLFAWRVPDWQAPDEPAHYNYIAQVATGEFLPIIEMGDWDNDYLEELKATDFDPEITTQIDAVQYENHQPPLYYWVATPAFILSDGSLFAVRMVSVMIASITVALSYSITVSIFPKLPHLGLAVMALVAFLPQNIHMLSSVNNDALAGLVGAVILLLCIRYLKNDDIPIWWIGVALGIGFITKTTIYFMAGVIFVVILLRWWQSQTRQITDLLSHLMQVGVSSGIFALLYWGRNVVTYGFPDFLGLQAHDAVVVGQKRRVEFITEVGIDGYWREAFLTTFHSFWGQFGWMEARLADALPLVFVIIVSLVILSLSGLLIRAVMLGNESQSSESNTNHQHIWVVLGLTILLAFAQYIYYNITFVQFQGRYLFVAIIPLAIMLVLGFDTWRQLLLKQLSWTTWLTVIVFGLFAPLDLYLIWRVIPCAVGC